jgi:hypothetical protein
MKTPPASENTGGVFHAFTSCEVAALERQTLSRSVSSGKVLIFFHDCRNRGNPITLYAADGKPTGGTARSPS